MIPLEQLPADPALPHLAMALDPTHMQRQFDQQLGEISRDLSVEQCRIRHIKYKPSRSCMICYEIDLFDQSSGDRFRRPLCARMYPQASSESRYKKAQKQRLVPVAAGKPLMHLPHLDMVVWTFPNDRKLFGLPVLMSVDAVQKEILMKVVSERFGHDWIVERADHCLSHYVPEHTCTVRLTFRLVNQSLGVSKEWTVFGKTYYHDRGGEIHRAARQLWQCSREPTAYFTVPRSLAYHEPSSSYWQEGLQGETLRERSSSRDLSSTEWSRVARAIAAFHASAITELPVVGVRELLLELTERAAVIGDAIPRCRAALSAVTEQLLTTVPQCNGTATLHGDLHPQNIFFTGAEVALIDLDAVRQGPPALDLGSWVAAAIYRALLEGDSLDQCVEGLGSFLRAYNGHSEERVGQEELNWFAAYALIAERCFRALSRLKAGRLEIVLDLLAVAERLCRGDLLLLARSSSCLGTAGLEADMAGLMP